ncbi:uncharacterized protein LOC109846087 [Asparagus officinalis]|uniref:uncharacterized protein LOC109846087 n=1 Tax=Asparagus officinalis TaxID=4686 RepID=UPI00098E128E|nr:uncharacterized protein LOC109846087 [Asparagus officinalis]
MWKQLVKTRDKVMAMCGGEENLRNLINSCHHSGKLRLSDLYNALSPVSQEVPWYNLVWGGLNVPKHSFICWLVLQDRILTQDRLLRRGVIDSNICRLCSGVECETRKHLFFECAYSCEIWNRVMEWLGFNWKSCYWNQLIHWFTVRLRGRGLKQKLKRLALIATIYYIWQERNARIFRQQSRNPDQMVKLIQTEIWIIMLNKPGVSSDMDSSL